MPTTTFVKTSLHVNSNISIESHGINFFKRNNIYWTVTDQKKITYKEMHAFSFNYLDLILFMCCYFVTWGA